MERLDDDELWAISNLEREVIDQREVEMLDNILTYSKDNGYSSAILFIGSGHKITIMDKIAGIVSNNEAGINWSFLEFQSQV